MRTRIVCGFGVVVALALVVASAFAASSGWKRYTFPAAPSTVVPRGTVTVQFPAGWRVDERTWGKRTSEYPDRSPSVSYRYLASWSVGVLTHSGTFTEARHELLRWVGRPAWGEGTPTATYVGESYVTLPMGNVLRVTLKWVPPKGKTRFKLWYERDYMLDRGIVKSTIGNPRRHLFQTFTVSCSPRYCKTHNGQLAAIMRSIRITP